MTSAYENGVVPEVLVRHRLLIAREYAGLDQEQLAELMSVSRSTISSAENGRVTPRRSTINAWALACGVPASWLFTGRGSTPPDGGGGGSLLLPRMDSNHQPPDLCHTIELPATQPAKHQDAA